MMLKTTEKVNSVLDNLFDGFSNTSYPPTFYESIIGIPYDVYENDTNYIVYFELSGVNKEDLELEVKNNTLVLKAKKLDRVVLDTLTRIKSTSFKGSFYQKIIFKDSLNHSEVTAKFEDGVLRVDLPKLESSKNHLVTIE